jgi:hypothetical protein
MFSSVTVKVKVSIPYVTTGLISVLYLTFKQSEVEILSLLCFSNTLQKQYWGLIQAGNLAKIGKCYAVLGTAPADGPEPVSVRR